MSNIKPSFWPLGDQSNVYWDQESTGRSTLLNHSPTSKMGKDHQSSSFEMQSLNGESNEQSRSNIVPPNSKVSQPSSTGIQRQVNTHVQPRKIHKQSSYQILNLTWTLYNTNPPKKYFGFLIGISFIARAYLFLYLITVLYLTYDKHDNFSRMSKWIWIVVVASTRVLFMLLILRVSLTVADGPLQMTLKNCWNKRQILVNQAFQTITWQVVRSCLVKAVTPPQLSFLYLLQDHPQRRFLLYSVINFIFLSIETLVFYPFVLIYCFLKLRKDDIALINFEFYSNLTISVCLLWTLIFLIYSSWLVGRGIRVKNQQKTF